MGLTPNLLNEDFNDCTSWTDGDTDTAVSEIDPAGQLRLDTNAGAAGDAQARRYKDITSPPSQFTIEVLTYFDALGTLANSDYVLLSYSTSTWVMAARFCSDGLYITKASAVNGEVGADIVLYGGAAADQLWRFQVSVPTEATATVEVFLNNVSQGTFDCDYEVAQTNGRINLRLTGPNTDNMVAHIKHLRIATGLGAINDTSNPIVNIF
jgi:hypothetical protein